MSPSTSSLEVVKAFARAWEAMDLDAVVNAFAPDAIYHNMPMDPAVGRKAIRQMVGYWLESTTQMRWELRGLAEISPGVVFAERLDTFKMRGVTVALPCAGVFEITDGLITAWRDYFDQATVERRLGAV